MQPQCKECNTEFKWNDTVIIVNDEPYCDDCLKLYPTGYVAYLDGEHLGEPENEDGQNAYEIFEYLLDE